MHRLAGMVSVGMLSRSSKPTDILIRKGEQELGPNCPLSGRRRHTFSLYEYEHHVSHCAYGINNLCRTRAIRVNGIGACELEWLERGLFCLGISDKHTRTIRYQSSNHRNWSE